MWKYEEMTEGTKNQQRSCCGSSTTKDANLPMSNDKIRQAVRERYGRVVEGSNSACCSSETSAIDLSEKMGYTKEELEDIPEEAVYGLGCGNPVAFSTIKSGDTVVDLGSGAGIDCFLAAKKVGDIGKVIGVDMAPQMIDKARENVSKSEFNNVEFRLGEIEHLPVANDTADLIISNCVINLSPDKPQVFREAFRILKPGGELMVSDIVLLGELPEAVRNSINAYAACVAGAMLKDDYLDAIKNAGFENIEIVDQMDSTNLVDESTEIQTPDDVDLSSTEINAIVKSAISIKVRAKKPE